MNTGHLACAASSAQQRIWSAWRANPATVNYNVPYAFHLSGPLDLDAIEAAFRHIVRRHESLRTVFREENGRVQQVILFESNVSFAKFIAPPSGSDGYVRSRLTAEANTGFCLEKGPL